jgi:GDP-D-mannose dehydratase
MYVYFRKDDSERDAETVETLLEESMENALSDLSYEIGEHPEIDYTIEIDDRFARSFEAEVTLGDPKKANNSIKFSMNTSYHSSVEVEYLGAAMEELNRALAGYFVENLDSMLEMQRDEPERRFKNKNY